MRFEDPVARSVDHDARSTHRDARSVDHEMRLVGGVSRAVVRMLERVHDRMGYAAGGGRFGLLGGALMKSWKLVVVASVVVAGGVAVACGSSSSPTEGPSCTALEVCCNALETASIAANNAGNTESLNGEDASADRTASADLDSLSSECSATQIAYVDPNCAAALTSYMTMGYCDGKHGGGSGDAGDDSGGDDSGADDSGGDDSGGDDSDVGVLDASGDDSGGDDSGTPDAAGDDSGGGDAAASDAAPTTDAAKADGAM
jgi:hypothetical protein